MIDEQVSRTRQSSRKAMEHFPCMLQARKHPPWVGSRVRRATLPEACRAQGLLPAMVHAQDRNKPTALCRMLGNSMSMNVLLSILTPLINVVRPDIRMQNPWTTGRLQYQLRESAKTDQCLVPPTRGAPSNHDRCRAPRSCCDTKCGGERATDKRRGHQREEHILPARRGGAIYEEIFELLGPGVTPRQLAGLP